MLRSGEPLAYVSGQLGHSKQSMTLAHYNHFIPDTKRQRGADRLVAELLQGSSAVAVTAAWPKPVGTTLAVTSPLPIQSQTERNGANQTEDEAAQEPNKLKQS